MRLTPVRPAAGDSLPRQHFPGGPKGRGELAFSSVAWAGPILAGGVESENILLSDRERGEGFQRTGSLAVVVLSAVSVALSRSERGEGFQRSGSPAVAVAVAVPRSERVSPVQLPRTSTVAPAL